MTSQPVDPDRVRDTRERKGMSVKMLADTAKVSERAIRYIESGRQPYRTTLHKIAQGLDVDITDLLRSQDEAA